MRGLKPEEMLLIYWFGCPNVARTKERLQAVARLSAGNRLKRRIYGLCACLDRQNAAAYATLYWKICRLFSPDDGTRPPGAEAAMVPDSEEMIAA